MNRQRADTGSRRSRRARRGNAIAFALFESSEPEAGPAVAAPVSARRRRTQSGNAFVEWMLVILPTMALLCFFFDLTWALFAWATIQNAAREGCRYAITFQTMAGDSQDQSIAATVQQWSMGLVKTTDTFKDSNGVTQNVIQINYFTTAAPTTPINPGCVTAGTKPCGGNAPGNIVQVSIQSYALTWLFPFTGTVVNPFFTAKPATISAYSYDVMGGYPAGTNSVTR